MRHIWRGSTAILTILSGLFLISVEQVDAPSVRLSFWEGSDAFATSAPSELPKPIPPTEVIEHTNTPRLLLIENIGVNALVHPVGLKPSGEMEAPHNDDGVAWYKLGSAPGESGVSVFAGHLDTIHGKPAVFWRLHELKLNDQIDVQDGAGNTIIYRVTKTASYDEADTALGEIFTPESPTHSELRLITCSGSWDFLNNTYRKRLVVFASQVE